MLYVIFWKTRDYNRIRAIKQYFGIIGMTLNKESVCDIPPELDEKFHEGAALGFYEITNRPIPEYYELWKCLSTQRQPLTCQQRTKQNRS